jgi:hypothetical protein
MTTKEYCYRLQHGGMSKGEVIGVWFMLACAAYFIIRSLI